MGLASSRDLVGLARTLPEWEHNELPLTEYVAGNRVKLSIRRYEPVGVVSAITPSNFPSPPTCGRWCRPRHRCT